MIDAAGGRRWIVGGLLLGLVAHAWFWNRPWIPYADIRIWRLVDADDYLLRRRQEAFLGVPFDRIAARLSALLPLEAAVRLEDRLASTPLWFQRASEVFYPRRISQVSGNVIGIDDGAGPPATSLGTDARGRTYVLRGGRQDGTLVSRTQEESTLRPLWFLLTTLACLGIGGVLTSLWNRFGEGGGRAEEAGSFIACAAAVGVAATVLTWLQLPGLGVAFQGVGLLACLLLLHRGRGRLKAERIRLAIRRPELWVALAVATLLLIRLQAVPIASWDGRSIWLFQAKQAYFNGTFSSSDLMHPEFGFAHPEYPKLFPAWLALFAATGSLWNERMASVGIAVLMAGCVWALADVAVKMLGLLRGIVLICVLFWSAQKWALGGYADAYLLFLLVTGALGLSDSRTRGLGWLALLVASLVKYEGLFLAVVVAGVFSLCDRDMTRQPGRWRPMLVFLPALFHLAWGHRMGFKGDFSGIRWGEVWATFGARMAVIGQAAVEAVGREPLIFEGALSGLAVVMLLMAGPSVPRRQRVLERCCLIVAVIWAASIFGAFLVTPRGITWHLENALDRLLLHPAALLLTLVLSLTAKSSEAEPVPPTSSGQRSCS
jgi:hypothetical protein